MIEEELDTRPRTRGINRQRGVTQKIPREATNLNGALFVHVAFDAKDRPTDVSFSWHRREEGNTLNAVLEALGEAVTEILREGAA